MGSGDGGESRRWHYLPNGLSDNRVLPRSPSIYTILPVWPEDSPPSLRNLFLVQNIGGRAGRWLGQAGRLAGRVGMCGCGRAGMRATRNSDRLMVRAARWVGVQQPYVSREADERRVGMAPGGQWRAAIGLGKA